MYAKSRYKGPSARITKRSKVKHFFSIFVRIGLPVFLLTMIVVFLRADFMQIKKVAVAGNKDVRTEEVEKLALASLTGKYFFLIPKSNFLFFKKSALSQKILADLPRVENLEISKNLNGTLEINLQERKGDFLWCSASNTCYLMSNSGLVFAEATPEEIVGKLIFRGQIDENPLWQNFSTEKGMQNYLKAANILNSAKFQVLSITAGLPDKSIFETNVGTIFLNPEEEMSLAAENAILLINDVKSKNPTAHFQYIDARFGNKVFYKLK